MSKIVFYCNDSLSNIQKMEYYAVDIKALEDLGHEVVICTKYREIPKRFDSIYIYWWTYALYPILLAKLRGKKAYVSGVFNLRFPEWQEGEDYFKRPLWQRLLMKWSMKLADGNLLTSRSDFVGCVELFRLSNCHYTPCCIADEYFEIDNNKESNTLMNIAWSSLVNLKRKGVFDLVSALQLVKKSDLKFTLKLVGARGDGADKLMRLIRDKGLEDSVECVGEVSKEYKLKLLEESSIYVQPSNYEGFGLATAEAMAAGLQVIACDVGDVRNTLGDHAIYVNNGNIEEIAKEISKLLIKGYDMEKMSVAKEFLRGKYSYQRKIDDFKLIIGQ